MIEELVDSRKWVVILFGNLVKATVIDTESERTVFLLCKNYRRTGRRLRGANETFQKIVINKLFNYLQLSFGLFIDQAVRQGSAWFELDCMIIGMSGQKLVSILSIEDVGEVSIDFGDMFWEDGVVIINSIRRDTGPSRN